MEVIKLELDQNQRCKRCHRKLKDEVAKKLGYGRICYEKIVKNDVPFLFEINKGD